ncbi:DUF2087 domain-containing protein [Lapillicoccus sp.]|uniref:DUF2087 domain-containing protein n=1 Tax=Lapillicoccus sp. TaxID=1909287 RepID=UPI00326528CB
MDRPAFSDASSDRNIVLRRFLGPDGSVRAMPTRIAKRMVVLDYVAQAFPIGQTWPESEVNEVLRRFHPDVAMLRRYLVEEEFLERRDGRYWRAGGTVEL